MRIQLDEWLRDVRYGIRTLLASPGYTTLVALTLSLGIGANAAIFSVINGVLLRPLPYVDGERLMVTRQQALVAGSENIPFSVKEVIDYREQLGSVSGFVEYHGMSFTLLNRGEPDHVLTGVVSANFFDVLGVRPLLGRTFVDTDDDLGADAVLVLSHTYWQQRFGGDPSILGSVFEMNDRPHTVVGVLPPIPQYPRENDVYMPTSACPFRAAGEARMHQDRTAFRGLTAFGRLEPEVSANAFATELSTVASRLQQEFPEVYPVDSGYTAVTVPLQEELTRQARPRLLILLGTTGLVLLITCANVANLTLARNIRRERELAMRAALGAGTRRILRQLVTETTLLALVGGAIGLLVAWLSLDLLAAFVARFTTRTDQIALDGWVLAFTLVVSMGAGLAFGTVPALAARADLSSTLKSGGGQSTDTARRLRSRNVLTIAQVAVSFMLLIGAGLLLSSFHRVQQIDPGFSGRQVMTAEVFPNWSKYRSPESQRQLFTGVLDRLSASPGVEAVAVANDFPMANEVGSQQRFVIEGRRYEDPELRPELETRVVSAGYFETVGIPRLEGRVFDGRDDAESRPVAVISRSLARRHWDQGESPLERRISVDDGETWVTIVGVVADVREHGLERDAPDQMYRPFLQGGRPTRVLVRASGDATTLGGAIRAAVHAVDPDQPVEHFRTLEQTRAGTLAPRRLTLALLVLFAGVALLICVTGIAGVVATSVSHRGREFGLRMALGASPVGVMAAVMRGGLALVLTGLGVGAVGAFVFARVLSSLLFDTSPLDPLTFVVASLTLTTAALAACYLPARRAMRVDPMVALRTD